MENSETVKEKVVLNGIRQIDCHFGNDDGLIREGQSEVDDVDLDLCYTYDCWYAKLNSINFVNKYL
ncbi:hypothetical protein JHK87_044647 [Glycine soja]|nr:hypothetical protein JHK87_044647 [Glycine soja]